MKNVEFTRYNEKIVINLTQGRLENLQTIGLENVKETHRIKLQIYHTAEHVLTKQTML